MKRYCKNIDITDLKFLRQCVAKCLRKKWNRRDVGRYFCNLLHLPHYVVEELPHDYLIGVAAHHMQKELQAHELHLIPIWFKDKVDQSNGKVRTIGIQDISQQLYDYVAVEAMGDIMRRLGQFQCASLPKKGTSYGLKFIKKWAKEKDIKYFVKLDVKKCFPSIPQDKLLAFLEKYIANPELLWLIHTLVATFPQGLCIGSYLSQYLCNLYLSQLYHHLEQDLYYTRRNRRIKYAKHVLFYMDDILLLGTNAQKLRAAGKEATKFSKEILGLDIKVKWGVEPIGNGIDMLGFRVYPTHTSIRSRVFLRLRRAFKHRSVRKLPSYWGYLLASNSFNIISTLNIHRGDLNGNRIYCRAAAG